MEIKAGAADGAELAGLTVIIKAEIPSKIAISTIPENVFVINFLLQSRVSVAR